MKISLNWIKDYVNLDGITTEEIVDKLTMSGLEVENYVDENKKYSGIIVGLVKEVEKHPDADKLTVCTVYDGKSDFKVICGAPNVKKGQNVVFAQIGSIIPQGEMDIKKVKIRGVESNGMICAEDELELSDDHSGIIILDGEFSAGTPISDALNLNDVILDIAITPNRPDALSHIGVARDLSAIFNRELRIPKLDYKESQQNVNQLASVEIEDKINCPRYSASVVTGVTVKESPASLKNKLEKIGLRPINNVVDVTNFILHELGQPLHAFDLDQLAKSKIVVKSTNAEMKFTTLDSKERILPQGTMMICDGEREVAIAGVMGGENSEVTESTKNILIESAYFNPSSIRRTSKKLQLASDASYRFERGTDSSNTVFAAKRAAQLIALIAGGEIAKGVIDEYPGRKRNTEITLRLSRLKKLLGYEVQKSEVIKIFQRLGINLLKDLGDSLEVVIPTFRPDIEREADLVEEVARIAGYEKIPVVEKVSITLDKRKDEFEFEDHLRESAISLGFNEMVNNPLIPELNSQLTGRPIEISNPQSIDMAYLRTSLIVSTLTVISNNIKKGEKDISAFEIGKVFNSLQMSIDTFSDFEEKKKLLFVLTGKKQSRQWYSEETEYDIYDLKGMIKSFLAKFSLDNVLNDSYNSIQNKIYDYQFIVNLKDSVFGIGGKLNNSVLKEFDISQPVYSFEADLSLMDVLISNNKAFKELLKYPKVLRDFAFLFDKSVKYASVKDFIIKESGDNLKSVELFDLFESNEIGEDKKSMAFSLEYFDFNRTLTDEEVDKDFQSLIKKVTTNFNAILRGK
ncbi:MAG: phenylalanine--tRNA ligase subunit beta [Ignavibacteriaceae bacterium]|nr:phenylalanine--tRNA ligase subunit beta [Chlorobium sp.]MCW8816409.1 phenylalanine--tRNA ligase subunit beta [Ignavibacteriaceae bacterium]MCW8823674.1 phenylalanine--tRNA ligase subunit beta [Ignavibacteriaceae bacterium]MCW9096448.1 phenylalanine--tRNA ligase subunit beta [Ignavibacteriaceae bacterium]